MSWPEQRKGRELQGLPVVDLQTGKALGEIRDIIYSPDSNRIEAFLLSDNGWLWGARILLYEQISSVGPDVVLVNGEDKVHNTKHHADYKRLYQDRIDIRGCQLISDSGVNIGTIKDLIVDTSGKVTGYEVSDGILQDVLVGRKSVTSPEKLVISGDRVIFQDDDDFLKNNNF